MRDLSLPSLPCDIKLNQFHPISWAPAPCRGPALRPTQCIIRFNKTTLGGRIDSHAGIAFEIHSYRLNKNNLSLTQTNGKKNTTCYLHMYYLHYIIIGSCYYAYSMQFSSIIIKRLVMNNSHQFTLCAITWDVRPMA